MYIPEFWCGVAAVLILETVSLIGGIIWFGVQTEKKKKEHHGDKKKAG